MDNDVHALKRAQHLADDLRRAVGSRDVRLDEMSRRFFSRSRPGRYGDGGTALQKPVRDCLARAFGAAHHEDAFRLEFTGGIRSCA
jgi:hypothetical protein